MLPLREEKKFKPRPQNRIFVLRRGYFQTFRRITASFFMGTSPPPPGCSVAKCQMASLTKMEIETNSLKYIRSSLFVMLYYYVVMTWEPVLWFRPLTWQRNAAIYIEKYITLFLETNLWHSICHDQQHLWHSWPCTRVEEFSPHLF